MNMPVKLVLNSGYIYYGRVKKADDTTVTIENPRYGLTTVNLKTIIGIYEPGVKA